MADFIDNMQNMVTGLDSGGLFAAFNTGILAKVAFFLKIAFWMVVVLFGIIFIYKYWFQYKTKLTIFKEIGGGGVDITDDKAKLIIDEQGKTSLQLFKLKKNPKQRCSLPEPAGIYKNKQGKNDHYCLWMDDNRELHPIQFSKAIALVKGKEEEVKKLNIRPQERSAWGRMEDEKLIKKFEKKDLLLKYATPAILLGAMITAFLIFFFASKEIGTGLSNLASTFQQVAASCTQLSP